MQSRKLLFVLTLIAILLISIPANAGLNSAQAKNDAPEYHFIRSWSGGADQIRYPRVVEIGPDDRIYTMNNGRMTIIDQTTRTYQVWLDHIFHSTLGASIPPNIAFDIQGNVIYPMGHTVYKFSPSGNVIKSWGVRGTEPGQLISPMGVASDENGNIYIADTGNQRIQVFSNDGNFIRMWILDIENVSAYSITISNNDELFVGDQRNRCIHKYDLDGNLIKTFGDGIVSEPFAMTIDEKNQLFVVNQLASTIEVFDTDGNFLRTIGTRYAPGNEQGEFQWPEGVAVDRKGNVFVADTRNNRIQKLDNTGKFLFLWGTKTSDVNEYNGPSGLALDKNGNLLIADSGNHRILCVTPDGTFLFGFGSEGTGEGEFDSAQDVAVDHNGNIYVADYVNYRIQKFNEKGEFIKMFGGYGELFFPTGIAINDNLNRLYVADTGNDRVRAYDLSGNFLFEWGAYGQEPGEFIHPKKIAIDKFGDVYVLENTRIQKFSKDGGFIKEWEGALIDSDINISDDNEIFVTNSSNHNIRAYDLNGNWLYTWGEYGRKPGQFNMPSDMVIASNGDFFVADSVENRIQVFNENYPDPDLKTGLILNGLFNENLDQWTLGGELPISLETLNIKTAMRLGEPEEQSDCGISQAIAHQTIYVDPAMTRPTLSFKYNMFVNDIIDYSDFFVAIQDGVGLNHLQTVLRGGYRSKTAPPAGKNMGWRTHSFDLSAYKGQHIRVVFSNRNLWSNSWGIWTYVDDVRVVDTPAPDGPSFYLPMFLNSAKTNSPGDADNEFNPLLRPETP